MQKISAEAATGTTKQTKSVDKLDHLLRVHYGNIYSPHVGVSSQTKDDPPLHTWDVLDTLGWYY